MSTDILTGVQVGNTIQITGVFSQNKGATLIDPDVVAAAYFLPGSTTPITALYTPPPPGTGSIQRTSQGIYVLIIPVDLPGTYVGRIYSTGVGKSSREFAITILPSTLPA